MINCIAIDDEWLALRQLERFIARIPDLNLQGTFLSVDLAQQALQDHDIDLLFLDIEMPDANGVEFAQQLGKNTPYIIFTTAYPQYAVDGFRLDAVDYLLKPLAFDDLADAIDKVKRRIAADNAINRDAIFVKASGALHKIYLDQILYIKGLSEYVQIFLKDTPTPITTFYSIKQLEEDLPSTQFLRIHKSFIINLQHIQTANRTTVTIANQPLPVGDKYRPHLLQYLNHQIK